MFSQSRPAFDHLGVTANLSGANLVSSFMATDVVTSRDRINTFGIRDMLVVHTATVASHFYHINVIIVLFLVSSSCTSCTSSSSSSFNVSHAFIFFYDGAKSAAFAYWAEFRPRSREVLGSNLKSHLIKCIANYSSIFVHN